LTDGSSTDDAEPSTSLVEQAEAAADEFTVGQEEDEIVAGAVNTVAREAVPEVGERQMAYLGDVTTEPPGTTFRTADLSSIKADPDCFFEFSYRPTLQAMVDAVMDAEAPVRDDVLAQRIARAHGWLRTGARIREQIALHLRGLARTAETPGSFLWKPDSVAPRVPFRKPAGANHRRSLGEISIAELADFVAAHPGALDEEDPPLVYARLLQVERLTVPSRERLQEAILRSQA
jgi:hypothetical protein